MRCASRVSASGVALCLLVLISLAAMMVSSCSTARAPQPPPTGTSNFVYTANAAGTGGVSALVSNAGTGVLTQISGSPYPAGGSPRAIRINPAGTFLFIANTISGDISVFRINTTSGSLTEVANSPFPAESGVNALAIDATGTYLYAVSGSSGNLWEYSIDGAGALQNLGNSPVLIAPALTGSGAVAIDPSGNFLYTASGDSSSTNVYAFTRNTGTGEVTSGASYPIGHSGNSMTTDPAGKFLIVVSTGTSTSFGEIAVFLINGTTGALAVAAGSPNQTGPDPSSVVVDPSGKFIYVANTADATISAFTLNATTGALTLVGGSPFPSGGNGTTNGPLGLAIDPAGKYLYVANASNDISVFTLNASNGNLTAIGGSPFPDGGNSPSGIAVIQKP
jgi:6-phosphogluconolactonase